ncbi:chemotaxis protein CheZ [Hylemonella gracilis str. Niagara R]|uniref:Protein phosphatase CheZ n=1 Tax=Hylemonella gracilis str. Niagara R TaxID=1458275 RepID=A0A016XDN9_9BURK|nr:protein phosphatase CheZ [Hylemonella gracilis]EYC50000.1 chemotaxis protein CheZ [Hylemonella gracilis str. Niagara R]
MNTPSATPSSGDMTFEALEVVHHKLGLLTRQLHDALQGLGLAEKLHGSAIELPDARSRLTYIAKLTGEAAEKVLNRVDQAKSQNDHMGAQTKHMIALLASDPVAAVAKGHVMNFLTDLEKTNTDLDQHLTEIMMAQDFHDLTGQVIARVLNLASNIEDQLIALLIQTAPADVQERLKQQTEQMDAEKMAAKTPLTPDTVKLGGPVVDPEKMASEVVTDQSQVDDLLASLGF